MTREELEFAIVNLQALLDSNENKEQAFQSFFEDHAVVFKVMGYMDAYPLKHLPLDEEMKSKTGVSYLEPDFILQCRNKIYEILDLKTPQEKLIRDIPNREIFYSKINEYISQVINYSEYFDDKANREWVKQNHSIDIHKDPDVTIVAGRDSGVDKPLLHKELRERSNRINILTYDDILTSLEFHYTNHYARTDSLPGFSLHAILNIQKGSMREVRYLFDCGLSPQRDRVSIYLDNERLHFEVIDSFQVSHRVTTQIPMELFMSNSIFYLSAYFGNGENLAVIQLRLNNSIVAENVVIGGLQVSPDVDTLHYTIGQDITGWRAYGPTFGMFEVAVFSEVHSLNDRMNLLNYFYERINSDEYNQCVHFHEAACMYNGNYAPPVGNTIRSQSSNLNPILRRYPFE